MSILSAKLLFNPQGGTDRDGRRTIGGNTTNFNDFNSMKYTWASSWYRQAVNNFWIPEEINFSAGLRDYKNLTIPERTAYDKIPSFPVFLDSIQAANLSCITQYITVDEVNLCSTIQGFQEAIHSQSYSYMLDLICSPVGRDKILYQWEEDEHPLCCNTFIGNLYNESQERKGNVTLLKVIMADYILEGTYFYSGFMFFYNLRRSGKMPGSVQKIRYINRDENAHSWLFRNIIGELREEEPQLFTSGVVGVLKSTLEEGVAWETQWGSYVIGDNVPSLINEMVTDYIRYLGNPRWSGLNFDTLYEGYDEEPESMKWVNQHSSANMMKTDSFGAKSTAYVRSATTADDLQIWGYNGAGIPA